MLLIGVALVTTCIASYSQRRLRCKAILAIYITAKDVSPTFIINKLMCFSFKSGCVVCVENAEIRHQLQLKKTNCITHFRRI